MSDADLPRLPERINQGQITILASEEEKIEALYRRASAESFQWFYQGLYIKVGPSLRMLGNVMAPFQRQFFAEITPSLDALRDGRMPPVRRYWLERTKKASKDADLAVIVVWVVAFAQRPFYGQIGAADKKQAGIVKERITHLLQWNPWLRDYVELTHNEIKSKRLMDGTKEPLAKCEIEASDATGGAHGGTPDLLVINELSHISRWEFVKDMMDNADGVPEGIVIIATNAGIIGTPSWTWRENAVKSDAWGVYVYSRPAPWHSKETLDEARIRDKPPSRYNRLWKGKWASGKGDAVDDDLVDRMFRGAGPLSDPEAGWVYLAGLDLGISHDHSAFLILGVNVMTRQMRVAYWRAWEPNPKTGKVYLPDVQEHTLAMCLAFRVATVYYDPHQAVLMAQQLGLRINCKEVSFSTPKNLQRMADTFAQVVEAGNLECYDDEEGTLRRDIAKFNIVEKSYGLRLEAVSDETGHADVGTALVIVLPYAVAMLGRAGIADAFAEVPEGDLTENELDDMPAELREIYELG